MEPGYGMQPSLKSRKLYGSKAIRVPPETAGNAIFTFGAQLLPHRRPQSVPQKLTPDRTP
jgi:hypothetical protein